jgi:hypothetical protein
MVYRLTISNIMNEAMYTFDIYYDGRRIGSVNAYTSYQAVDDVANRHPSYERRLLRAVRRYV